MKKASIQKDTQNGVWDLIIPNQKTKWYYTKQEAQKAMKTYNQNQQNNNTTPTLNHPWRQYQNK